MKEYLLLNNYSENSKKVEKYVFNYINELKIHFNLSDAQIIRILTVTLNKLKKESRNTNWLCNF